LAKQRKAGFFPVWLTCDAEKLRQRKNTPERRARLKEIDLTTIEWWLHEFGLLKVQHPNALTLDTSNCEPEQTAQRILEHIHRTDSYAGFVNPSDKSNGYEAVSGEFISGRTRSSVGAATMRQWAKTLPPGGDVLDLGCGPGAPISQSLADEGLNVFGVDASPSMIAAFRARFPHAPAERSAVEDSQFFDRSFDGVVAWGLMFLLPPDAQVNLIHKVAAALKPGGRFLFTAPHQICEWSDNLTGKYTANLM
jgi:2-polyprenyl-3-methyl-5-hydroxy-6-metoxy-1,4-benzoquinol methylase